MGINKFALRLEEKTFAERAVFALSRIAARRICFVTAANQKNDDAALLPLNVPRIGDVFPNKAALGGIYTALSHSKKVWIAVLACDYPFVTGELLARLLEAADLNDPTISAVAPIQSDGRVQPLCAFYRVADCLPIAERLLETEEIPPVRSLLEQTNARLINFSQVSDLPGADNFFTNINTPQDFLLANKIKNEKQDKK